MFVNRRLEFLSGANGQLPFAMPAIRITVCRRGAIRSGTSYTTGCPLDQSPLDVDPRMLDRGRGGMILAKCPKTLSFTRSTEERSRFFA